MITLKHSQVDFEINQLIKSTLQSNMPEKVCILSFTIPHEIKGANHFPECSMVVMCPGGFTLLSHSQEFPAHVGITCL